LEEGEFVEDDIGLDDDKSRPPVAPKRKIRKNCLWLIQR
jgi:hypothetical protein